MAGMKIFDEDEVLDDDAAEGEDPPVATDEDVDGGTFVVANAAGVGKEATIQQIIRNLVRKEVADLLRNRTVDLRYEGAETWVRATGNNNISSARGAFGATELNALSDWAVAYVIPSGTETTGEVVVRLEKGANPTDFRIMSSEDPVNVGDITPIGFVDSPTYDYYLITLAFVGGFAVGETIALEHHGTDPHSSFYGSAPLLESAIADINTTLGGKQDVRPFDVFLDRNYYVRTNRDPVTYYLILHNIVSGLIAGVDTIRATVRGQLVHSAAFNPDTATEQVVPIELNATEIGNILNNLRTDTSVNFEIEFRNGSTVVESVRIQVPVLDAPPVRERRILVPLDLTRTTKTHVLPDNYAQYRKMLIGTYSGRNTNEAFQPIPIAALTGSATLSNIGSNNNHKFDWNRTNRTITYDPEQSANSSGIIYLELTS